MMLYYYDIIDYKNLGVLISIAYYQMPGISRFCFMCRTSKDRYIIEISYC